MTLSSCAVLNTVRPFRRARASPRPAAGGGSAGCRHSFPARPPPPAPALRGRLHVATELAYHQELGDINKIHIDPLGVTSRQTVLRTMRMRTGVPCFTHLRIVLSRRGVGGTRGTRASCPGWWPLVTRWPAGLYLGLQGTTTTPPLPTSSTSNLKIIR